MSAQAQEKEESCVRTKGSILPRGMEQPAGLGLVGGRKAEGAGAAAT